jgi:hypothetical protein
MLESSVDVDLVEPTWTIPLAMAVLLCVAVKGLLESYPYGARQV